MSLIERFGDIFQVSYVTADRDRAVAQVREQLGVDNFFCFEGASPVISRGETHELKLKVAVANTGKHQFEIIEPVSGPTWIYTDGFDLQQQVLHLHHVGVAVVGPYQVWEETVAELMEAGDEIVQMSSLAEGETPHAMFAYVDNRKTLGHYTEYLWWSEAMNGKPVMPDIKQGKAS